MNKIVVDHRTAGVLTLLLLLSLRSVHHWLENHVPAEHAKQYNSHSAQPCDLCDSPNLPAAVEEARQPTVLTLVTEEIPVVTGKLKPKRLYPKRGPPKIM